MIETYNITVTCFNADNKILWSNCHYRLNEEDYTLLINEYNKLSANIYMQNTKIDILASKCMSNQIIPPLITHHE